MPRARPGDITWNFEKFLVSPDGRDRGPLPPAGGARDPSVVSDIKASSPASPAALDPCGGVRRVHLRHGRVADRFRGRSGTRPRSRSWAVWACPSTPRAAADQGHVRRRGHRLLARRLPVGRARRPTGGGAGRRSGDRARLRQGRAQARACTMPSSCAARRLGLGRGVLVGVPAHRSRARSTSAAGAFSVHPLRRGRGVRQAPPGRLPGPAAKLGCDPDGSCLAWEDARPACWRPRRPAWPAWRCPRRVKAIMPAFGAGRRRGALAGRGRRRALWSPWPSTTVGP